MLSTRELLCWTALFFIAISFRHTLRLGWADFHLEAHSFDAVKIIAWGCALRLILGDTAGSRQASRRQFATIALVAAASLFAPGRVGQIALIPCGLYMLRADDWSDGQRRAGAVFVAIGGQHLFGVIVPILFGHIILKLDTAAAGLLMQLFVPGTIWHGNILRPPHDVGVTVLMACSSFANLSLVALCFASLHSLDGGRISRRAIAVVCGTCAVVILLNTTRLVAIAKSLDSFAYWHDGTGGQIFALAMTLITITLCSLGSRWAVRCP